MKQRLLGFVRALALGVPTALIATAHPAAAAACTVHIIPVILLDQIYFIVYTTCS